MKEFHIAVARFTRQYPGRVLFACLFFIVLLSAGLHRITIDTSVDSVFPDNHPLVLELRDFKNSFISDDKIIIGVESEQLFSAETTAYLGKLAVELGRFPEISKVIGLPTLKVPYGEGDKLSFRPALATEPGLLLSHPLFASTLVAKNGKATLLQLYSEDGWPTDFPKRLITFLKGQQHEGVQLYVAGVPIIEQEVIGSIYHDLFFLPPIVAVILIIFMTIIWRDFLSIGLCLTAVGLTLAATTGLMGWAAKPITVMTPVLPPLLMAATVAAAAHVLTALKKQGSRDLPSVYARVFRPCLFAALTTGVGFGSLYFNPIMQVKEFGLFAMAGIIISFWVVFGCIVPLACLFKIKQEQSRSYPFMERILQQVGLAIAAKPKNIVALFSIVLIGCALLLPGLKVDISVFDNLDPDGETFKSYGFFQENFSGVSTLELDLKAGDGTILEPEVLSALLKLARELEDDERVNGALSIADFISYLNGLIAPDSSLEGQNARGFGHLLFLYQLAGYGIVVNDFITADEKRARMSVMIGNITAKEFFTLSEKVQRLARRHLPETVEVTATGTVEMYSQLNNQLFAGLLKSLGAAFVLIGVLLVLFLQSAKLGWISFLVNAFPLLIIYAAMRLCGLPIDSQTAMIGCISLGISVDGTVHLLHNLRSNPTVDYGERIQKTWLAIGVPVLIATLTLIVVFAALTISSFRPIHIFGLLSALGLFAAFLADIVYLPALLQLRKKGH